MLNAKLANIKRKAKKRKLPDHLNCEILSQRHSFSHRANYRDKWPCSPGMDAFLPAASETRLRSGASLAHPTLKHRVTPENTRCNKQQEEQPTPEFP